MKYECSIVIARPRKTVIALVEDTAQMGEWQDGLISFTHLSGEPATNGAKSLIRYKMGRREVEMTETIESYQMPESLIAIYEADKVWNRNENWFVDLGDSTRWDMNCEFLCSGLVRIFAVLMPGMFRKQTMKMLTDFKAFAERQPED